MPFSRFGKYDARAQEMTENQFSYTCPRCGGTHYHGNSLDTQSERVEHRRIDCAGGWATVRVLIDRNTPRTFRSVVAN